MINLLKDSFARSLGLTRKVDVNYCFKEYSLSSFSDFRACSSCDENCIDKQVFIIDFGNSQDVCIVELEKFFSQFANVERVAKGGRCDLMMYDNLKCAFVELSCLEAKYLEDSRVREGKRTKARRQLCDSIMKLRYCTDIAEKIDSYEIKYAIFAYQEKRKGNDRIYKAMSAFNMTDKISINSISDMGNGFSFVIVKYPEKYVW